jgi:hypothetical protein
MQQAPTPDACGANAERIAFFLGRKAQSDYQLRLSLSD